MTSAGIGREHVPLEAPAAQPDTASILLVEDNEQVRQVFSSVLRRAGFAVVQAAGVVDACSLIPDRTRTFSLVICDVVLGDGTARDVMKAIRQDGRDLPLLLISGHIQEEAERRLGVIAGEAFLQKPFAVEALLAKVHELTGIGA